MNTALIRNCRFKFQCEQDWSTLPETDDPAIRHCACCNEDVHLCRNADQLHQALSNNWCVAIARFDRKRDLASMMVGEIESLDYNCDTE